MYDIIEQSPTNAVEEQKDPIAPQGVGSERRAELEKEWERLVLQKPYHSRGKPSEEEIERRREYALLLKEWKCSVEDNPAELAYVKNLMKKGK